MRTLLARGPFGLDSISNETFSPPWRPSKSPSVPLRWKKYSCPSSALINPRPRSETSFLMVPVGISISYLSNGGVDQTAWAARDVQHAPLGAGPAAPTQQLTHHPARHALPPPPLPR